MDQVSQWLVGNLLEIALAVHLHVILVGGGMLFYWWRAGLLRRLRAAAAGLSIAMAVAGLQVVAYVLNRLGGDGVAEVVNALSAVGAIVELAGVWLAIRDTRQIGRGDDEQLAPQRRIVEFVFGVLRWLIVVLIVVELGASLTTQLVSLRWEGPPVEVSGTRPDAIRGRACDRQQLTSCYYSWRLTEDRSRIAVVVRRNEQGFLGGDDSVDFSLLDDRWDWVLGPNCPATVDWKLSQDYVPIDSGSLTRSSDQAEKRVAVGAADAQILRFVAERTDRLDCAVRLELHP
jgi:hypothetical protein